MDIRTDTMNGSSISMQHSVPPITDPRPAHISSSLSFSAWAVAEKSRKAVIEKAMIKHIGIWGSLFILILFWDMHLAVFNPINST